MFTLSPFKRRILYVTVFEIFAIILSTLLLMLLNGGTAQKSLPVAIVISVIAIVWNYLYNTAFEATEIRLGLTERTPRVRIVHACGFEAGLVILTIPILMVWFDVGIWAAFKLEAALLAFFLFYTYFFTLLFDKIFTLPGRARTKAA